MSLTKKKTGWRRVQSTTTTSLLRFLLNVNICMGHADVFHGLYFCTRIVSVCVCLDYDARFYSCYRLLSMNHLWKWMLNECLYYKALSNPIWSFSTQFGDVSYSMPIPKIFRYLCYQVFSKEWNWFFFYQSNIIFSNVKAVHCCSLYDC